MITNLFFCFNQPNYSRWAVRVHDNLLKMNTIHPSLAKEFQNGRFGIRTSKELSRMPIDLTLEQTINADAASQRTGISAFTNSLAARQRWSQSHFLRMSIFSNLLETLDLNNKEDVSADLKSHKIKKNAKTLNGILDEVEQVMNPFSGDIDKGNLYNIGTGKAASKQTSKFLLNVNNMGNEARTKFIQEVNENPTRFEDPIKRCKLSTFANEDVKFKKKTKSADKVVEIKMERNLFGRLLCSALERKIDIAEVLKYPLTPVPLSMCHLDGTIATTSKSVLVTNLEKLIISSMPSRIDCKILDGMHFLRHIGELPTTFGKISEYILKKACYGNPARFDLVFDNYISPSIKDVERDHRNADRNSKYQIVGPFQARPSDMSTALKSYSFKESLIDYLVKSWDNQELSHLIGYTKVYVTTKEKCFSFRNEDNNLVTTEENHLKSDQGEADYRIMLHIHDVTENSNVVIKCNDSDILLILLVNMDKFTDKNMWMEVGFVTKNLGMQICKALPAFHAFTGCDYSPAFLGKGKLRPLKILLRDKLESMR